MRHIEAEVLAPAGSYESMAAAVAAGADAVYIGGSKFGARAYANNLDEDHMLDAIDYVHLHGVKLYMTVNTLVKESEMDELYAYLKPYYERGLDAVIVQDMGVFSYIRTHFPDLPIHASTQMTITGAYGAKTLAAMGATRVVTARELSLQEIAEIHRETDVEIESFVHGALCYCYSGQCLYSSIIGGRSGNRGRCAQPCRLPYDVKRDGKVINSKDEKYVLSLKDLSTLELIPDMIDAGIYSLKIEGRMKSPRYTAGVVSMYRKYVDLYLEKGRAGFKVSPQDKKMLLDLFDRGGQTEGYYTQHNNRNMVVLKEKPQFREGNQELFDYLDKTYVEAKPQVEIKGHVEVKENLPAKLTLECGDIRVEVLGDVPQLAQNQPMTEEKLLKQMKKTGNTPFTFSYIDAEIVGQVFMPLQSLNELRRAGIEALQEKMIGAYHRAMPENMLKSMPENVSKSMQALELQPPKCKAGAQLHISIENMKQLAPSLDIPEVSEIYLDSTGCMAKDWADAVQRCQNAGKSCLLMMPQIFRTEAIQYFEKNLPLLKEAGFAGIVVRAMEETAFLKEHDITLPMVYDYTMYTFNHLSDQVMLESGASRLTLPVELNSKELEDRGCHGEELLVYGYLPMMVSAQCIRKTLEGCRHTPELLWMKDRIGKEFPVKNHCVFCYNTIYNSSPLSLLGFEKLIGRMAPGSIRLQFTIESTEDVRRIITAYADSFIHGVETEQPVKEFTRGHFKRGVE